MSTSLCHSELNALYLQLWLAGKNTSARLREIKARNKILLTAYQEVEGSQANTRVHPKSPSLIGGGNQKITGQSTFSHIFQAE